VRRAFAEAVAAAPPQITSPLRGVVYSLRAQHLGQETITLRATTGAGVRDVYWFVGSSFLARRRRAAAWRGSPRRQGRLWCARWTIRARPTRD